MAAIEQITVRDGGAADRPGILAVAEDLAEWFDDHARRTAIPTDILHQRVLIAEADERVVAFITLYVAEGCLNIGWIGVLRRFHRHGIGSRLLREAEALARRMKIGELAVMTLGDGVDYAPYEMIRAFYLARGFVVSQRSKTDNPGCPEQWRMTKRDA